MKHGRNRTIIDPPAQERISIFAYLQDTPLSVACCLTIFIATAGVFVPALENGFVNWGDDTGLVSNPSYRGLGWTELRWMFTTFYMGQYQPLTWLTFAVDYLLWGLDPFAFHLTSIVLHGINAVVFYWLSLRLFSLTFSNGVHPGKLALISMAGFSALAFGIHPLRVQSVAWISQRGNLLAAFFLVAAILLYVEAVSQGKHEVSRRRWMIAALSVYILSLCSNASGLMLPIVLVLLDIYPLRRLIGNPREWIQPQNRRLLWEKVPFVLVACVFGYIAWLAHQEGNAAAPLQGDDVAARMAQGLFGALFHLWKTILPIGLAPLDELPADGDIWSLKFLINALTVACATLIFFTLRRHWPAGLAIWLFSITLLLPIPGVMQGPGLLGPEPSSYLASMGWPLLAGSALFYFCRHWNSGYRRRFVTSVTAGVACASIAILGALTWQQTQLWHDSEKLWTQAVAMRNDSANAHYYLGVALSQQDKLDAAEKHFRRSLEIRPAAEAHSGLGQILLRRGNSDEAMSHYREALQRNPDCTKALYNLGIILSKRGVVDEAIASLRRAAETAPRDAEIRYDFAVVLAMNNNLEEATEHFRATVDFEPNHSKAYYNLGIVLARTGKQEEAMESFSNALKADSLFTKAHYHLGMILTGRGNNEKAIDHLRQAVRIEPEFAEAHESLGRALLLQGNKEEAARHYQRAIQLVKNGRALASVSSPIP